LTYLSLLTYILTSALSAWASEVYSRKFGEEQANLSENGRSGQEAPVQPGSTGFSLGSASRG
jgi:hypothetical protein